jgi:ubiquinone/menaquinone biosynthesis C-methylase UbiE
VTVQAKRTMKAEKLARIYDDEIAPVWGARFGKMLLRNLEVPARGQVLDISCGTGWPTTEILRRMTDGSRLIAIDASSAMLDVARRKVADLGPMSKKVFFRTESAVPKLSFADDVYDLVICNLGLDEVPSLEVALRDFARVAKRGGEVRCTLPLAGTFQEFHDLYREVLIKHDKHEALDRLDRLVNRYPTVEQVERAMKVAQLSGRLEVEEFSLLFKSSREFFFAPVIEYGPLADWKEIAGGGQEMQDVFWYIKEAIDAYFDGRPFHVTVLAGCLIGTKQLPPRQSAPSILPTPPPVELSRPFEVEDEILHSARGGTNDEDDQEDTGLPGVPSLASGSVASSPSSRIVGTEAEELGEDDMIVDDVESESQDVELDIEAEQELDAFIDGKKRPPHLDD